MEGKEVELECTQTMFSRSSADNKIRDRDTWEEKGKTKEKWEEILRFGSSVFVQFSFVLCVKARTIYVEEARTCCILLGDSGAGEVKNREQRMRGRVRK